MQIRSKINAAIPSGVSAFLALASSVLLSLAFPDFELAPLAWFALVPLFFAINRERKSAARSFVTGWIFGTAFFFLTAWWLTFAPITYAGFPFLLAYFLLFCVTLVAGVFPAIACWLTAVCLRRFGNFGIFAAPVFWIAAEFLRYWLTGNNWNTIGYSQAFNIYVELAAIGGVELVGFLVVLINAGLAFSIGNVAAVFKTGKRSTMHLMTGLVFAVLALSISIIPSIIQHGGSTSEIRDAGRPGSDGSPTAYIIGVQPNVPMNGLNRSKWDQLRQRQADLATVELEKLRSGMPDEKKSIPVTVILPESPMNYQYEEDPVFRSYINGFAVKNNVSVLFNSAEPDRRRENGYFNSAVMVSAEGKKIAQYDKIHLLPFGEFVPLPEFAQGLIPPMVGRFSFGEEYDLLTVGEAKAGVMICFESHFPSLSREYVKNGADVLIEMTNDGYLGPTPVLRQHLASAAFRAAETKRPLLRVTNVGVTAYVDESGRVFDSPDVYTEATRTWGVFKSDGSRTIYVRYGEWFTWLCILASLILLILGVRKGGKPQPPAATAS